MNQAIPSQNIELLKSLLGKRLISIKRQIFKGDMDLDNYEQIADGTTEFKFNDDQIVCFSAITEANSVGITNNVMQFCGDRYIILTLINNSFWEKRVNQEIEAIYILQSIYTSNENPSEFGVEFKLKNGASICIEYLDEEDFPDTIRVLEKYNGSQYIRRTIS